MLCHQAATVTRWLAPVPPEPRTFLRSGRIVSLDAEHQNCKAWQVQVISASNERSLERRGRQPKCCIEWQDCEVEERESKCTESQYQYRSLRTLMCLPGI